MGEQLGSPFNTLTMATTPLYNDKKLKIKMKNLEVKKNYTVQVTNLTTGATTSFKQRARGGSINRVINFEATGVTRTVVKTADGNIVKDTTSVATSDIDCCIAKLVHDAINCTCKCNKCDEDLKRAHKIHLLIMSAKYEAHTLTSPENANAKVLKAKELCTEVCACGC